MFMYLGQSIQEWTKLNLWKTAFKKFEVIQSDVPFKEIIEIIEYTLHKIHVEKLIKLIPRN